MALTHKYNCEDSSYINVRFFLYFIAYKQRCSIVEVVEWLLTEKFENTINPYEIDEETGVYKTSDDLCEVNDNILKRILECGLVGFIVDIESEERKCITKLHYKIDALNRNSILKKISLNFYQAKDFSYTLNPDDTVTSPTKDETDTVNELIDYLDVSDMTIRRDLDELESSGKLLRIHGGAQSLTYSATQELSHNEKTTIQIDEKKEVAKLAAKSIEDNETLFLGPGTTIELLAHELTNRKVRVITNNLPVFDILQQNDTVDVSLIGGDYRKNTKALVGPIANMMLKKFNFSKAFISSNGVHNEEISTYSIEEGELQQIALNNAHQKYLLIDNFKFNRDDFYVFYNLHDIDYVVTDSKITPNVYRHYSQYVEILKNNNNEDKHK